MNPMKTLMGALPIVAAAFGRKFNVQVRVCGDQAFTDGKVIQIPAFGEDPDAAILAWGYLTHEAGHCRETDMEVYTEAAKRGPLIAQILNILEDVRVENAIIRVYPGSRKWLDDVIGWLVHNRRFNPPKEGDPPPKVLGDSLMLMARYRYRHQASLKDFAAEAERVLRQVFPAPFVHRFLGLLTDVPGLQSTADTADLATRIMSLIEEEAAEPPPAPQDQSQGQQGQDDGQDQFQGQQGQDDGQDQSQGQPGQDDSQDQSQDQQGQGDSQDQSQDQQGQGDGQDQSQDQQGQGDGQDQSQDQQGQDDGQDQSQGQQGQDDGQDQSQGQQGQGDGQDQSQGQQGQDDDGVVYQPGKGAGGEGGDGRKALQEVLSSSEDDLPEDTFQAVAQALSQHQSEENGILLPSLEQYDGDHDAGRTAMRRVRGESAKLTARLQGLVQASQMTATRTVRRGNRLDPTKLYRAGVRDDRVFARSDERMAPNTAICLAVDLSGSMGMKVVDFGQWQAKDDYRIALDAAMALALALESINGVTCSAVAFPCMSGNGEQVTRILSHGDRVARRVGAFVQGARGNTPMTGALWYAAADLLARREERKVIMVMTDGEPDDFRSAKDMVTKATAAGIELIGVGIGVRVDNLFPTAITIRSVADLKGQLFSIAEKLLLR